MATPSNGDDIFSWENGVVITFIHTVSQFLHLHRLIATSWKHKISFKLNNFTMQHWLKLKKINNCCFSWNSPRILGPLIWTRSSPLPAPFVYTLKSATSFTRTPLGCKPRPMARQAFGLLATKRKERLFLILQYKYKKAKKGYTHMNVEVVEVSWDYAWTSQRYEQWRTTKDRMFPLQAYDNAISNLINYPLGM